MSAGATGERLRVLRRVLLAVRLHVRRLRLGDPRGYCIACRKEVPSFLPYRRGESSRSPLMRELDVVGSDVERHACPNCGAHDRERHLLLYFARLGAGFAVRGTHVLHIAPESALSSYIRENAPARYVQADLHPSRMDVEQVDLCRMPYPDCSFDLVIANHVLEHVEKDEEALTEIARVLRPNGKAVLQTPFSTLLTNTIEDPHLEPARARFALFGQDDHVRLYGRDLGLRAARAGLAPCGYTHDALLPDIDPRRYGVNPREPLMMFRRME